jgi:hypothetical protein
MTENAMDISQNQQMYRDFCRLTLWSTIAIVVLLGILAVTLVI